MADASTRLVNVLMSEHSAGRLFYTGRSADGRYRVTADGRYRAFSADGMAAWLRGRELGEQAGPATPPPPAVAAEIGDMRRVLVNPSLGDQFRTRIRAEMDRAGIGVVELANRTGRTRHAVRVALRWGATQKLSMTMAEQMMAAAGGVTGAPGEGELAGLADAAVTGETVTMPEPVGMVRMRAAAIAHEHGVATITAVRAFLGFQTVRVAAPIDPNTAYRATAYEFDVNGERRMIDADVVVPWLTGLADARSDRAAELLTEQ